jgi:hypothetical protein
LRCGEEAVANSDEDDSVIEQRIRILAGARTEDFEIAYPDLAVTIRLSNGCILLLVPDADWAIEAASEDPIQDWELFYPHGMWLGVGPGPKYRFQRADQPFD